ncbi:Kelch repeat-containing protein, partial [Archangium sp.]|uniref:Kelch repeat-containing protein n=1 Tax=Archangium sp. TaxID=1872627 RepID=UPI002EDB0E5C
TADYRPSYISSGELSLQSDGHTLRVQGEKAGIIIGESGSGSYYTALYPNFFTSTGSRTVVASTEPPAAQSWAIPGFLSTPRAVHTATLLNTTGDVLVVSDSSADIHNPYSHASAPALAPIYSRRYHTATWLQSAKKVLVTGGWGGSAWHSTSELFDPVTGSWTFASLMNTPRGNHTATLLGDEKVLVVGGFSTNGDTHSVEQYDPSTNTWSNAAPLNGPRGNHTATVLYSGQVLVTGGTSPFGARQDAQLYDPATNAWTSAGTMTQPRSNHLAVRLYSGYVLVLGGGSNTVDLYDPYSNTWSAGPSLYDGESAHTVTLLYSGKVLVTHKYGRSSLYDPSTNTWTSAGQMAAALDGHATTLLHSGDVLVTGGFNSSGPSATVQRYTP